MANLGNIPTLPKNRGKMPPHDVKQELYDLSKSWKDLPLSALESEYGYVHHSRRMAEIRGAVDNATPRTMKLKPAGLRGSRPKSAGARPRKAKAAAEEGPKRPTTTRDGRKAIEKLEGGEEKLSEQCKEILRGGGRRGLGHALPRRASRREDSSGNETKRRRRVRGARRGVVASKRGPT